MTTKSESRLHAARHGVLAMGRNEGILCGISAGANVLAALRYAREPQNAGNLVEFLRTHR